MTTVQKKQNNILKAPMQMMDRMVTMSSHLSYRGFVAINWKELILDQG